MGKTCFFLFERRITMSKNHTLFSMLAGAALAGGFMYLKKSAENMKTATADDISWDPEEAAAAEEGNAENNGWRATYTDENGEELSPDEIKARVKEEAGKAFEEFKADAKVVSAELLVGLKKAAADMKVAVEEAQKAAAARRAVPFEEEDTTGEAPAGEIKIE